MGRGWAHLGTCPLISFPGKNHCLALQLYIELPSHLFAIMNFCLPQITSLSLSAYLQCVHCIYASFCFHSWAWNDSGVTKSVNSGMWKCKMADGPSGVPPPLVQPSTPQNTLGFSVLSAGDPGNPWALQGQVEEWPKIGRTSLGWLLRNAPNKSIT